MSKRKPERLVQLNDVISEAFDNADLSAIASVLQIHLTLEALLIEMIETVDDALPKLPHTFPDKTEFLAKRQKLPAHLKEAFDHFNDFRNDIAHIFAFRLDLAKALELARNLQSLGVDFTDNAGHYSEEEAIEYYGGLEGILAEIGWCILAEASFQLQELGGRDIFS